MEKAYEKALNDGAKIVNELETMYQHGIPSKKDIEELIPNISSSHGGQCGKELKIILTKKML